MRPGANNLSVPVALRPFTPGDYPALAALVNAAAPEFPVTEAFLRFRDESGDTRCRRARWVAEAADGQIVGAGEYGQRADMFDPRRFSLNVYVHPQWQGRGVGRALYEQVTGALAAFDPLSVRAFAREDNERAVRFLADRGFVENMRDGGATLDLRVFDPAPWTFALDAARNAGLVIGTLADLRASDPHHLAKLHDLSNEVMRDVPPLGKRVPVTFDAFVRGRIERPDLVPEGYFVAVHEPTGEYAGMSELRMGAGSRPGGAIATGVTGVRRAWRRKHVALALKLRGILHAKNAGYAVLKTWNASHNQPILALNARLGFVREPWRIHFVKTLSEKETP